MPQFISAAENWLIANTSVPTSQRHALTRVVDQLLHDQTGSCAKIIAISGAPGTGKSTLAAACAAALEDDRIRSIVLSLDDYYLPAATREELSRTEHPLFSARGVPGTHDLSLLLTHLNLLADPDHPDIKIPRFDKSNDDRLEDHRIVKAGFVPEFIFIEGWVVGVPPQSRGALLSACSKFEQQHDPDAKWRSCVNAYMFDYFKSLDPILTHRWYLQAPDWASVIKWRLNQAISDQQASAQQGRLNSRGEVSAFLNHFKRICDHMQATCSQWADVIIQIDADHLPGIVKPT